MKPPKPFACHDFSRPIFLQGGSIIPQTILDIFFVQGVSAIVGDGEVIISWNNTSSAISYNIYWSETAGLTTENGTLISNIASPYIHTGRIFGTTYYYIVTAVNEAGESPASEEVSATLEG